MDRGSFISDLYVIKNKYKIRSKSKSDYCKVYIQHFNLVVDHKSKTNFSINIYKLWALHILERFQILNP